MPEKVEVDIVEKYGDFASVVRRLCTYDQVDISVLVAARGARTDIMLLHRRLRLQRVDDFAIMLF